MNLTKTLSAVICIVFTTVSPGFTIRCYKCDSTADPGCQEEFDVSTSGLETVECSEAVYQGKYCVKTTGMYGGKPGTRRFCTSKNLGNICNYIQRPNEQMEFRACVFTCTTDLCNGSGSVSSAAIGSALVAAVVVVFAEMVAQ